ncbi:MAG TPA: hypothetical protein PL137_25415 [Nocardioides sp.]|nr:hypothetical protein [Nocardioides sp.]
MALAEEMPEVALRAAAVPAAMPACSPAATVRKPLPLPVDVPRLVKEADSAQVCAVAPLST